MKNWKYNVVLVMMLCVSSLGGMEAGSVIGARAGYRKGYDAGQVSLVVPKPDTEFRRVVDGHCVIDNKNNVMFCDVEFFKPVTQKRKAAPRESIEAKFKAEFSWAQFTYNNNQWCADAETLSGEQVGSCRGNFYDTVCDIELKFDIFKSPVDGCGTATPFGPEFNPHRGVGSDRKIDPRIYFVPTPSVTNETLCFSGSVCKDVPQNSCLAWGGKWAICPEHP